MNQRDFEYIDTRLCSPCNNALDAFNRMNKMGAVGDLVELTDKLMRAIQHFTDECRIIRQQVQNTHFVLNYKDK